MYHVLIVDDEKPVRQAIEALGPWEKLQVSRLSFAVNGKDALEKMEENLPHMVLVDMKMPVMDGAAFLKEASVRWPGVQYLVISGFDDFEYTKQAIRCNVVDYLLKPIVEAELVCALEKAAGSLETARSSTESRLKTEIARNMERPLLKEQVAAAIVENRVTPSVYALYGSLFPDMQRNGEHRLTIFRLLNLPETAADYFEGETQTAVFAVCNVLDELCSSAGYVFSFRSSAEPSEILMIISGSGQRVSAAYLRTRLMELFRLEMVSAEGNLVTDFFQLGRSYLEARKRMDQTDVKSGRLLEENPGLPTVVWHTWHDQMLAAVESGQEAFVRRLAHRYGESLGALPELSVSDMMREYTAVRISLVTCSRLMRLPEPEAPGGKPMRPDTLTQWLTGAFAELVRLSAGARQSPEKQYIRQIREFIDRNYFREISLTTFSEKYFLSKEYLSRLFRDEYGHTIYEYVLKVRMDKACEMLSDPGTKISLIAQTLGYKDSNYFSRAFKSHFGFTPSEYRAGEKAE